MIAQQVTSNATFLPRKTARAHDDVISFGVIVRRKISKLCPPCQLVPTTSLDVHDETQNEHERGAKQRFSLQIFRTIVKISSH